MSDKTFVSWEAAVSWLMNQPDKQQLVRDCYYDPSVQQAAERYYNSPEWQAISRYVPDSKGFSMDLGAGRGIASYALARDGWQVAALEPDSSELVGAGAIKTLALENNLPISVSQEFGERINFDANTFELVFARQVLHHANDLEQLCAELFRVLKPGGSLIAVRDHVISSKKDLAAFFDVHPLHSLYGGENAYTSHEYLVALKKAGFKVKRVLRSFDSVINFAPYTEASLKAEIQQRIIKIPVFGKLSRILNIDILYRSLLRCLSFVDRRPGRLYSFVCFKPEEQ